MMRGGLCSPESSVHTHEAEPRHNTVCDYFREDGTRKQASTVCCFGPIPSKNTTVTAVTVHSFTRTRGYPSEGCHDTAWYHDTDTLNTPRSHKQSYQAQYKPMQTTENTTHNTANSHQARLLTTFVRLIQDSMRDNCHSVTTTLPTQDDHATIG
jgi:hypothetical protein